MDILFLHNNFPAQYRLLTPTFANKPGNRVVFGSLPLRHDFRYPNVYNVYYKPHRQANPKTHPYLINAENAVVHGQAVYRMIMELKKQNFIPDIICGHAGWGPLHFVKDALPDRPLLGYFEWFYGTHNTDYDFLPDVPRIEDDLPRLRVRNTALTTDLMAVDHGICPTQWQAAQIPDIFKSKMTIMHDGIDTDAMVPKPGAKLKIDGLDLSHVDEIVTYVARGMEPYRGFPQFLRAACEIQRRRKKTHIVVVGENRVAYGRQLPAGQSYKDQMLEELKGKLNMERIHFTGSIEYGKLLSILQASSVHVYLTVPFVLSWSMLEAMSAGCLVIGSNTAPVKEFITDAENGLLVDFFDHDKIADRIEEVLDHPDQMADIRKTARAFILKNYSHKLLVPKHVELIESLVRK